MPVAGEKRQFTSTDNIDTEEPNKRQAHEFDCVKTGSHVETDPTKIQSRLKQIQFGKNTIGYDNYIAAVPKKKRYLSGDKHPRTPDAYEMISKRGFDGKLKSWRRSLHRWDSQGDTLLKTTTTNPTTTSSSALDDIVNQQKKRLDATTRDYVTNEMKSSTSEDIAGNVTSSAAVTDAGSNNGTYALAINAHGAENDLTNISASVCSSYQTATKMDVVAVGGEVGLGMGGEVTIGESTTCAAANGMEDGEDEDDDDIL